MFGPGPTHRPLSSWFLGLPYRILNINHKKELLRGLWVYSGVEPPPVLTKPLTERFRLKPDKLTMT